MRISGEIHRSILSTSTIALPGIFQVLGSARVPDRQSIHPPAHPPARLPLQSSCSPDHRSSSLPPSESCRRPAGRPAHLLPTFSPAVIVVTRTLAATPHIFRLAVSDLMQRRSRSRDSLEMRTRNLVVVIVVVVIIVVVIDDDVLVLICHRILQRSA